MPGEGSMMHMIITLRNNKKLLRRKGMFKKERSFLQSDKSNYASPNSGIPSEVVAPELLEKIRLKAIGDRKKRNLQFTIFLCVILPILGFLGYMALHNYSFGFDTLQNYGAEQAKHKVSLVQKKETYLFYLNDGDARLKKHQYHNAIFQYKKALEVFPSEFDAQYRLALAYSYQCQYKFEGCEEGMTLVEKLERQLRQSDFSISEVLKKEQKLLQVRAVFEHWGV